ncbi:MAG: hypothetical protein WA191_13095 [Telluria sp.]
MREEFRARVQNSGLSVNAYITAAVFGQAAPRSPRAPPLDQKMVATLLFQAARISDRLEVGAQRPSGADDALSLQECRAELAEIRSCLMLALGRTP